jgi:peptide/nickel transport system permease protein
MKRKRLVLQKLLQDKLALSGFLIIFIVLIVAILAPYLAPYPEDVARIHLSERLLGPSGKHFLGTDDMGRDILSRIIFGTRISFTIAFIAVGLCIIIGVPIGLYAGFNENWLSAVLMRTGDVFLSVPRIVLALAIASALGRSMQNIILALSITYWPFFSSIVFAETRKVKKSLFVEATVALGASPVRTIFLHVLPNVASPIIIRSSVCMGFTLLPTPEWGIIIAESRRFLPDAWWYATFPGLAIFITVMGFNMLGDGLRDILDPRIRRGGWAKREGDD